MEKSAFLWDTDLGGNNSIFNYILQLILTNCNAPATLDIHSDLYFELLPDSRKQFICPK